MFTLVGALALSWAVASPPGPPPDHGAEKLRRQQLLQALYVRIETHRQTLAERCTEPGLLATMDPDDTDRALHAVTLYEETAMLVDEMIASGGVTEKERDNLNLLLARSHAGAAEMLLKAHACDPQRVYLDRAGKQLRRSRATAGTEPENVKVVDEVQEQLDDRRLAFPPPRPKGPPRREPCPVCAPPAEPRVMPPPWPERLVLRFESGVAWGSRRLDGADKKDAFSHNGVTLGVSLLGRAVLAPRWALLFGPSYTYWRANDETKDDIDYIRANSHHLAGRLELAIGVGRRWRDAVSVHPGLELGIQSVFHAPSDPKNGVLAESRRGPSFVASVGVCFASGSLCMAGRVGQAIADADDSPTVAVTLGVDIFGAVRAYRARRGRR